MSHYQDDPDFIGPRLPKEHPAYRINLTVPPLHVCVAIVDAERVRHGEMSIAISRDDFNAALAQRGRHALLHHLATAIRTVIPAIPTERNSNV